MMKVYFLCIYCFLLLLFIMFAYTKVNKTAIFIFSYCLLSHCHSIFPFIFRNIGIAIAIDGVATSVVDREKIVYHISVTRNEHRQLYLQLIIVDRYEYDEHSTRLMEHLKSSVLNKLYESEYLSHVCMPALT